MGRLGQGLASLIPKRDKQNAEDVLDRIDAMEVDENEEYSISVKKAAKIEEDVVASEEPAVQKSNLEEIDHDDEVTPMPSKPLVTPLPFDPFEEMAQQAPNTTLIQLEETEEKTTIVDEQKADKIADVEDDEQVLQLNDDIPEPVQEEEVKTEEKVAAPEPKPVIEDEPSDLEFDVEPTEDAEIAKAPIVKEDVSPAPRKVRATASVAPKTKIEDEYSPAFGDSNTSIWDKHEQNVEHVAIGDIQINPLQPRRSFDPHELADLASSIEQHGILQPLVVRRLANGEGYELIAGERRLRSAKTLGWDKVPCVIRRDVKSDQSRLVFALIENIQREGLNPIEEAMAYKQLNEEYGLTHEEIGQRVGKSRVGITNIVRILQLPAEIQRGLMEGKISIGHAKAILMIPDEEKQIRFYQHLLDEGLTVRKAEIRARRIQRTMKLRDPLRNLNRGKHPLALKYSPALEERFGYNANVKYHPEKNNFEVIFRAHSEQEIQELVARLMGDAELPKDVDQDVIED